MPCLTSEFKMRACVSVNESFSQESIVSLITPRYRFFNDILFFSSNRFANKGERTSAISSLGCPCPGVASKASVTPNQERSAFPASTG